MPESTEVSWPEIKTAYAAGAGLRELARQLGIPEGTVLARAKREGWTQQIRDAQSLAPERGVEQSVAIRSGNLQRNPVVGVLEKLGNRTRIRLARGLDKGANAVRKLTGDQVLEKSGKVKDLVDATAKVHGWQSDAQSTNVAINLAFLGQ